MRTLLGVLLLAMLTATSAQARDLRVAIIAWTATSPTDVALTMDQMRAVVLNTASFAHADTNGHVTVTGVDTYGYYVGHPEIPCAGTISDKAQAQALAAANGYVANNYGATIYVPADCRDLLEGTGMVPWVNNLGIQHFASEFMASFVMGGFGADEGGLLCRDPATGAIQSIRGTCILSNQTAYGTEWGKRDLGFGHDPATTKVSAGFIPRANELLTSTPGTYTLYAQEYDMTGVLQSLKVGGEPSTGGFALEKRDRNAEWEFEDHAPELYNGVEIHWGGYLLDGSPDGCFGPASCGTATLTVGHTFYDPLTKWAFTVTAADDRTATVVVSQGAPVTCTTAPPTVTVAPTAETLASGATGTATITITNNNTAACAPVVFTVSATAMPGESTPPPPTGFVPTGQDIGATALAGSTTISGSTITVRGSGADIIGWNDSFHFASQPLTGDGTLTLQMTSFTNTDGWAKAGLMIRDGFGDGAAYVALFVTPTGGADFQRRWSTPGDTAYLVSTSPAPPVYLRIARVGSTFTASTSADGVTWTERGNASITMGATVQIGAAVTSHNQAALATAVFQVP